MSLSKNHRDRLLTLLDAVCDQRASAREVEELERIVLASSDARRLYLQYVDLHGTLLWDAAAGPLAATGADASEHESSSAAVPQPKILSPRRSLRRRTLSISAAVCLALIFGIAVGRFSHAPGVVDQEAPSLPEPIDIAENRTGATTSRPVHRPVELPERIVKTSSNPGSADETPDIAMTAAEIPGSKPSLSGAAQFHSNQSNGDKSEDDGTISNRSPAVAVAVPTHLDDVTSVTYRIDRELARIWSDMETVPSPRASDAEWLRRVQLSVTGRIPTVEELTEFVSQPQSAVRGDKRRQKVDELLADSAYVRHFATVWSNLLIGRAPSAQVNAEAFQKFLRLSFAENRPWNEMVAELLSAEGRTDENGATNYLVAHLNNQAVPATAITSRLFLGQQLHCAQCHNHPFNNVQQASFWELNSLFQQTEVVRVPAGGERRKSNRMGPPIAALVTRSEGGPIYYETMNGLMKVAFPRFNGQDVDPSANVNRRDQLAMLLKSTDQPQLSAAFVNRMWSYFFGAGFTTPVDDMGPHNPPCHPEVLNTLRDEFIASGYDVKQLIRWITASDAYQRSSLKSEGNERDDPAIGDIPLFSRVYPRPMSAEQLYDSLLVATRAHHVGQTDWEAAEAQRSAWLKEFVISLENDENDEAETLSGNYGQALTLMNGELMQKAIDLGPGSFLGAVWKSRISEAEKIEQLYQAALSRSPTSKELTAVQKLLREASVTRKNTAHRSSAGALQDLFWALLNSNEFAIIH